MKQRQLNMNGRDEIMDVGAAAEWLKIPKSTIYKLCAEHVVPAVKVGKHWRFHRPTLEKWFFGQMSKPKSNKT